MKSNVIGHTLFSEEGLIIILFSKQKSNAQCIHSSGVTSMLLFNFRSVLQSYMGQHPVLA